MRHSLPIALALAAFTVAGAGGPASAISNNLNPWTTSTDTLKKPPAAQTKQNPPASQAKQNPTTTQTNQNSSASQTQTTSPAHANQNPSAPQTTAPNSSTTRTSSNPGNQIKPAADPKKDIAKQIKDIKENEAELAVLQQKKSEVARLVDSPRSGSSLGPIICSSSGCTRTYITDSYGVPRVSIKVSVDAKGILLPGEFDKMVKAETTAIDNGIAARVQWIADDKKQIDADYSVLPGPGNGGIDSHKGSTALHQQ